MRCFAALLMMVIALGCGDPKNPGFYTSAITLDRELGDDEPANVVRLLQCSGIAKGEDVAVGAVVNYGRTGVKEIDTNYLAMFVYVVTDDRKVYNLLVYDKRQKVLDWWSLASKGFPRDEKETESSDLVISFRTKAPERGYYYLSELTPHGHIVKNVFLRD